VVGVLIRMRMRLYAHSMQGTRRVIGLLVGLVVGLVVAVGSASIVATTDRAFSVAALMFTAWTAGWLFAPILTAGSDESLQPEHFSLLPISPRRLALGLTVAAACGVAPIMTLIAFGGLVVAAAGYGIAALVVAVVGVLLQLGFVIIASRVVVGWLGAVLRSRRGRDLGILLTSVVGLLFIPARLMVRSIGPILRDASDSAVAAVVRWFPSSWAPLAVQAAANGQWPIAVGLLAALLILTGLLMALWAVLLRQRLTTASRDSYGVAARVGGGWLERVIPATAVGAVMTKEIRFWWRDARRRALMIPGLLMGLGIPVLLQLTDRSSGGSLIPFAAVFVIWITTLNSGNLYGYDPAALRHILVTGTAPAVDVRGRQLAWGAFVAPVAVLAALVFPGVTGSWPDYPWVLALTAAGLGAGSGVLMLLSVYAAFPAPRQRGNPFASNSRRPGCANVVKQLGTSLVLVIAVLPTLAVLITGGLFDLSWLRWSAVLVGALTGVLWAWLFGRIAARRLGRRGPELLRAVQP
jgi:ABC-2 type transport system permease protein